MTTECTPKTFALQPLGRWDVGVRFDGGKITLDASALLLRETEPGTGILQRFAAFFTDHRDPNRIKHTVYE